MLKSLLVFIPVNLLVLLVSMTNSLMPLETVMLSFLANIVVIGWATGREGK